MTTAREVPGTPGLVLTTELSGDGCLTVPVHAEEIVVSKRTIDGDTVKVATATSERVHQVDEELTHERVEIERVAIGRVVETVPDIREEGDVTIMPVVEETIVVERRLVLKEEVRIRRVRTTERHQETILLREQEAIVTRIPGSATNPQTDQG